MSSRRTAEGGSTIHFSLSENGTRQERRTAADAPTPRYYQPMLTNAYQPIIRCDRWACPRSSFIIGARHKHVLWEVFHHRAGEHVDVKCCIGMPCWAVRSKSVAPQ